MKKLLLKLAFNLVIDVLFDLASRRHDEANSAVMKDRWKIIMAFLMDVKEKGLP